MVDLHQVTEAEGLPPYGGTKAELMALTRALKLGKDKRATLTLNMSFLFFMLILPFGKGV